MHSMGLYLMSTETGKGCKALCSFAIWHRAVEIFAMLVCHLCNLMFALDSFRSK